MGIFGLLALGGILVKYLMIYGLGLICLVGLLKMLLQKRRKRAIGYGAVLVVWMVWFSWAFLRPAWDRATIEDFIDTHVDRKIQERRAPPARLIITASRRCTKLCMELLIDRWVDEVITVDTEPLRKTEKLRAALFYLSDEQDRCLPDQKEIWTIFNRCVANRPLEMPLPDGDLLQIKSDKPAVFASGTFLTVQAVTLVHKFKSDQQVLAQSHHINARVDVFPPKYELCLDPKSLWLSCRQYTRISQKGLAPEAVLSQTYGVRVGNGYDLRPETMAHTPQELAALFRDSVTEDRGLVKIASQLDGPDDVMETLHWGMLESGNKWLRHHAVQKIAESYPDEPKYNGALVASVLNKVGNSLKAAQSLACRKNTSTEERRALLNRVLTNSGNLDSYILQHLLGAEPLPVDDLLAALKTIPNYNADIILDMLLATTEGRAQLRSQAIAALQSDDKGTFFLGGKLAKLLDDTEGLALLDHVAATEPETEKGQTAAKVKARHYSTATERNRRERYCKSYPVPQR